MLFIAGGPDRDPAAHSRGAEWLRELLRQPRQEEAAEERGEAQVPVQVTRPRGQVPSPIPGQESLARRGLSLRQPREFRGRHYGQPETQVKTQKPRASGGRGSTIKSCLKSLLDCDSGLHYCQNIRHRGS